MDGESGAGWCNLALYADALVVCSAYIYAGLVLAALCPFKSIFKEQRGGAVPPSPCPLNAVAVDCAAHYTGRPDCAALHRQT